MFMTKKNIDICMITETWLCSNGDDRARAELARKGFKFDDVPRLDRLGVGWEYFIEII